MAAVAMSSTVSHPLERAELEAVRPAAHVSPAVAGKAWTGRRSQTGFTLMELMIVVAIVAILAAVALPAYQNSVMKTWRSKATACLTEMAQSMERRFTGAMSYEGPTGAPAQLPPNTCTTDDGMAQHYAFSFTADPTATDFELQAVPQGSQATQDARCGTLTIDETGTRDASGTAGAAMCW